jgi:hypothetical protein
MTLAPSGVCELLSPGRERKDPVRSSCCSSVLAGRSGGEPKLQRLVEGAAGFDLAAFRNQRQRSLVAAGEGQRLIMAGGGSSWLDLGLFLIARIAGVDAAMQLARIYLITLILLTILPSFVAIEADKLVRSVKNKGRPWAPKRAQ